MNRVQAPAACTPHPPLPPACTANQAGASQPDRLTDHTVLLSVLDLVVECRCSIFRCQGMAQLQRPGSKPILRIDGKVARPGTLKEDSSVQRRWPGLEHHGLADFQATHAVVDDLVEET